MPDQVANKDLGAALAAATEEAQKEDAAAQSATTDDTQKSTTTDDGVKASDTTTTPAQVPELVALKKLGMVTEEDGQIVFRPKEITGRDGQPIKTTTVYKGATPEELFENINRGIVEKDATIQRLKDRQRQSAEDLPATRQEAPPERPDIEKIRAKIVADEMQKSDLTGDMFSPSFDWDAYKQEHGEIEAYYKHKEIKDFIRGVNESTSKAYQEQSLQYANHRILTQSSESVDELLESLGVDLKDEEVSEIIDGFLEAKTSYDRDGILRGEKLSIEVFNYLRKNGKLTPQQKSALKAKVDETIIPDQKKLPAGVKTEGGGSGPVNKSTVTTPKNLQEAKEKAIAEYMAGQAK
jgi:hypothetical protein